MLFTRTQSISPADAAARMRNGDLVVIDVREPVELRGGRIKGADSRPSKIGA